MTRKPKKSFSTKASGRRPPRSKSHLNTRRWLPDNLLSLFIKLLIVGVTCLLAWMFYLNARITTEFEGQRWSVPARVYARPLELYAGLNLGATELVNELDRLGYRAVLKPAQAGEYLHAGQSIELVTRPFQHWDGIEPQRHLMLDFQGRQLQQLRDDTGQPQLLVRLDPLQIGSIHPNQQQDRILIQLDQVPRVLKDGLIAVEDRNFHHHLGVSPTGIIRALLANIRAGRTVQGGSTLTQQLVKNYFLDSRRSLIRKGNEALMAVLMEWHYSKDEILESYLNEVYLAQDGARAIHGFGLAAQEFFGVPVTELRLHQVALLIGMVKGPSLYNPRSNPDQALKRRQLVLTIMADHGVVTPEQAQWAGRQPLDVRQGRRTLRYPSFLDLVQRQLRQNYRADDLASEGLQVYTSLDPRVQSLTESALIQGLERLEDQYRLDQGSLQGSVIVTQPESGEALAVVGDRQVRNAGFNRALDSRRPVGSLMKPVVYLTALENGFTLASKLDDSPVVVEGRDGSRWEPENFDRQSHGEPLLLTALTRSYNQATARLGMQIGIDKVVQQLQKLGFERSLPAYPSIVLGSEGMSPLEVANIYGTFAADGFRTPVRAIRAVTDAQHRLLSTYEFEFEQQIPPQSMYLLQYAMKKVMTEGTGRHAYSQLDSNLELAGKTGTTDGQRDSWFSGYSQDTLAVVWVGRDDNGSLPLTGSSGALRIWTDLLQRVNPRSYLTREPDQIEWYWVNSDTGSVSKKACPGTTRMPFRTNADIRISDRCDAMNQEQKKGWFQRWFR